MRSNHKGNGKIHPNGHGSNGNGNGNGSTAYTPPADGGKLVVITAPLTEAIDHAGYFIQMGMASMPKWMEFVMDKKYPAWKNVQRYPDGQALYLPEGWTPPPPPQAKPVSLPVMQA